MAGCVLQTLCAVVGRLVLGRLVGWMGRMRD